MALIPERQNPFDIGGAARTYVMEDPQDPLSNMIVEEYTDPLTGQRMRRAIPSRASHQYQGYPGVRYPDPEIHAISEAIYSLAMGAPSGDRLTVDILRIMDHMLRVLSRISDRTTAITAVAPGTVTELKDRITAVEQTVDALVNGDD